MIKEIKGRPGFQGVFGIDFSNKIRYGFIVHAQSGIITNITELHSVQDIRDWAIPFGIMEVGDKVPNFLHMTARFCPDRRSGWSIEDKFLNLWKPSRIQQNADRAAADGIPPNIHKLLNTLVSDDEELFDHLINWLAVKFQTGKKIGTAWVFTGVQGSGKGIFIDLICSPLFGNTSEWGVDEQVIKFIQDDMEGSFNGDQEKAMIICIDEIHSESSRAATKLRNKLKSRITENQIVINRKQVPQYNAPNYADYVFLSNHADAMHVEQGDRRFNVAPHRNEKTIVYTAEERKKIADEMQAFANYLKAYDADYDRAATAINNAAKADMQDASSTAIQSFFQQLPEGNFDSIYEVYDPHAHMSRPIPPTIANWIKESRQSIEDEGAFRITPTELAYLYQAVMGERDLKSPRPMKAQADRNNWTGYKQQSLRCLHGDTRRYQIRGWKYRIIDDNLAPALEILDTLLEHIGDPTDNKVVPFPEPMRVDDATDDN